MVSCPRCRATLPDGAAHCQFCGVAFGPAPRAQGTPAVPAGVRGGANPGAPAWVWPAYLAVALWWVLNGVWTVVEFATSAGGGFVSGVGMLIGVLCAVVGLGLLLRVEAARGVVNVLCFLKIIFGAIGFFFAFASIGFTGAMGAVAMLVSAFDIAFAGFMMYLIGETEPRAPNF